MKERSEADKFYIKHNIIIAVGLIICLILVVWKVCFIPEDRAYFKVIQTDGSSVIVHTDDIDNAIRNNNGVLNLSDLIVESEQ